MHARALPKLAISRHVRRDLESSGCLALAITLVMTRHSNYLSIRHRGKAIPYGGDGELRDDGDANYGFTYAKGNEAALRRIPELASTTLPCYSRCGVRSWAWQ